MPVLIDGHNLIGRMPNLSLSDADDEAQLVMLLRRYATKRRGRRLIVVFDGGVYGHPDNLNGYGIETHFAKSPRDADSELIRRIRAIKRHAEWQVVSSDNAVAGAARAHGVPVVGSDVFARQIAKINEPLTAIRDKRNDKPLSKAEVEEWMRFFGVEEGEDEEYY